MKTKRSSALLVEKLLDAAFHELQHDTGESDPEWRYQRKNLKAAFKRILRTPTPKQVNRPGWGMGSHYPS